MDVGTLKDIAVIVGGIGTPAAILAVILQNANARRTLAKDYVQLALEILRGDAQSATPALRAWSADILAKYSPVPIPPEMRDTLRKSGLRPRPNPPTNLTVS
jgi:hypothetical protein